MTPARLRPELLAVVNSDWYRVVSSSDFAGACAQLPLRSSPESSHFDPSWSLILHMSLLHVSKIDQVVGLS